MNEFGGQSRIRISGPGGLLAVVPNSLGFHPTDSLVLMCFTGERSALGPVARVDLPRGRDDDLVRYLTGTALTHAERVVVVCYPRRRRRPVVLDDLIAQLRSAGVGVMDVLIVHAGRFWTASTARSLRLTDSLPVPDQQDPTVQTLAAERALSGRAVLTDRAQLRSSIAGPRGSRRRVAERALSAVAGGCGADLPDPDGTIVPSESAPYAGEHVVTLPDRVERLVDRALAQASTRGAVEADVAAEIALSCLERPLRDGILMRGLFELDRTWLSMLVSCATWTPDHCAAGICAVLAVIAYRHGDGALAQVSADRCLLAEPGNHLTQLLIATMSAGLPPEVLDGMLTPPEEFIDDFDECDGFDECDLCNDGACADPEFGVEFGSDDDSAVA